MAQKDRQNYLKDHLWGIAGTILFHGLLLVLFFTLVFTTPIPPWPEEGGGGGGSGLEINLGTGNDGMSPNQYAQISMPSFESKKSVQPVVPDQQEQIKTKSTETEDMLAQETEDAPSVPVRTATKPKKTDTKPAVNQPPQPVAVKQPVVDPNALYKKSKQTSDGTTGKTGNQGREDGTTKSGNYGGTGSGKGTGSGTGTGSGIGSGTGSGVGSGNGSGTGSGTSFELTGRSAKYFPKPVYNSPEQGMIVVSIKVDQNGKVTYASAGAKGTTISEIGLRQQAEAAARRTTFSPNPDAPEEQRGTITYRFLKSK